MRHEVSRHHLDSKRPSETALRSCRARTRHRLFLPLRGIFAQTGYFRRRYDLGRTTESTPLGRTAVLRRLAGNVAPGPRVESGDRDRRDALLSPAQLSAKLEILPVKCPDCAGAIRYAKSAQVHTV